MAPEVLRNLHEDGIVIGRGIDVWALGVLLFELTHGRVPFIRPRADWEKDVSSLCPYRYLISRDVSDRDSVL